MVCSSAHANIALIKYWGKRDSDLFLPTKSSLSISLDCLQTTTKITFSNEPFDTVILNNKRVTGQANKIVRFLDTFRSLYKIDARYIIETHNNFPTAAGLASSASGFAALAKGLNKRHKLDLSKKELSILARRGSGSACRSIDSGFVLWHKGNKPDGSDSYAQKLFDSSHWPELQVLVAIVETKEKSISSRNAMQQTVATSQNYKKWVTKSETRITSMIDAIERRDFFALGELAECDAFEMHRCMQESTPATNYWTPKTKKIVALVQELRKRGIRCYCTIDAGPNVKIITLKSHVHEIRKSPLLCYTLAGN